MKNKKTLYYLINLIFLVVSLIFINYTDIFGMLSFSIMELLTLILICIVIHFFKFIRIYFILLEEKISLKKMLKIYIKTSFVSTILPFKIGETFKMYSYGHEIKNYPKGIFAVLIDKFFDALVLCAILIPYGLIKEGKVYGLAGIMLLFILAILIIFIAFEGTYYYLNKFFIINGKTKKSIYALDVIEKIKKIYISAKEMIRGRQLILLALTVVSWIIESVFVYILSIFMKNNINFSVIINYINDGFFGINNILFNKYIYLCTSIFLVIIIIMYAKKCIVGGKKIWKK